VGISFERAEAMAVAAAAAGLVRHAVHTVTLTGEGLERGSTLTAPRSEPTCAAGIKTKVGGLGATRL